MKNLTFAYWCLNEGAYIPEWIEFHLLQGVDHFIVYVDDETDNVFTLCKPYIDLGILEVRLFPTHLKDKKNFWMMEHMIAEQKMSTHWLAFHAIDERLFSPTGLPLPIVLRRFENDYVGGVSVNWEQVHSSGHIAKPKGLIIENYTKSQGEDPRHHVKTIIRPDCAVSHCGTPHNFTYRSPFVTVDENDRRVDTSWTTHPYDMNLLKNIHYCTLSKEEYEIKMNKGVLDGVGTVGYRRADADDFWNYYHCGNENCPDLLVFVNLIKQTLRVRYSHYPDLLEEINH